MEAQHIMGTSSRAIGTSFGLRHDAVHRHMRGHLTAALAAAAAALPAPIASPEPDIETGFTANLYHVPRALVLDDASPAVPQVAPQTSFSPSNAPSSQPSPLPSASSAAPAGAMGLLQLAHSLRDRALGILTMAEAAGDQKTALAAIREARGVLESLARLEPAGTASGASAPLANSSEWHAVRGVLVAALASHPEAALAVADALEEAGLMS